MALLKVQFDPQKGVIIPVFIATAKDTVAIEDKVRSGEKDIKTIPKFGCLIDTGASRSCVSERLAKKLKLKSLGAIQILTASEKVRMKIYSVTLIIPMVNSFRIFEKIEVAEYGGGKSHDVLLGRDILMKGIFQTDWNGQAILGF